MAEIYEKKGRRYVRRPELDHVSELPINYMIMSTIERCLGSKTIGAMFFVREVEASWDKLPAPVRDYIQRVVDESFAFDDEKRATGQMEWLPLGMDCDRAEWEKLRKRWRVTA